MVWCPDQKHGERKQETGRKRDPGDVCRVNTTQAYIYSLGALESRQVACCHAHSNVIQAGARVGAMLPFPGTVSRIIPVHPWLMPPTRGHTLQHGLVLVAEYLGLALRLRECDSLYSLETTFSRHFSPINTP